MLVILLSTLFIVSCNKDEDKVIESQVLAEYLESTSSPLGKDYVNTDMPSIIAASELKTLNEAGQVYIMDIRSADDFNNGHIANAVNVALADVVNHIKTVDMASYTKVAIVCYTGQTSGFATSILRLLGYDKVFSLKWGMCSWHVDFAGRWQDNIGNTYATQFSSTAVDKGPAGEMPNLTTGYETGQEILDARVSAILTQGYSPATVTAQVVFDNLSNYYIVNYWPADQYADPGHIPGAMQYTPKQSMKLSADLKTLPADKPIVVYCYTGQTSSFLAAYLRLLGYDAKSLLYGANSMIYQKMVDKNMTVFKDTEIMGYEYVVN